MEPGLPAWGTRAGFPGSRGGTGPHWSVPQAFSNAQFCGRAHISPKWGLVLDRGGARWPGHLEATEGTPAARDRRQS